MPEKSRYICAKCPDTTKVPLLHNVFLRDNVYSFLKIKPAAEVYFYQNISDTIEDEDIPFSFGIKLILIVSIKV